MYSIKLENGPALKLAHASATCEMNIVRVKRQIATVIFWNGESDYAEGIKRSP